MSQVIKGLETYRDIPLSIWLMEFMRASVQIN